MQIDNMLRMALVFGENKAPTFTNNLEKMIALILYEKEKQKDLSNTQLGMTVIDIIEQLKANYGLNFSDTEIIETISRKNQKRIICVEKTEDFINRRYTITPQEYDRIESKEDTNLLPGFVELFLSQYSEIQFSKEDFLVLIKKHFYVVFNSNATVIIELINRKYEYLDNLKKPQIDFNYIEKEAINKFLNWDNKEKNEYIYELISCCFDYCMMTSKQTSDSYKSLFNKKVFYLDANIVFRMMGLNHISRKRVIDTFLSKCKEVGIKIRVTNQTRKEINDTISHYVKTLGSDIGQTEPVDPEAAINFGLQGRLRGFYNEYYQWCKDKANRIGDYKSFEYDLKKKANDLLAGIEQKDFDSFAETNRDMFNTLVSSLVNYKTEKNRNTNAFAIQTDVNNYMFIVKINNTAGGTDFFSIHNYLISADHAFCDWVKEVRPETIPIVVLPSIWYSIMLKYTERTKEDYDSFVSFLNFSMSNNDEKNSAWKMEVLKKVLQVQEPIDIKNQIAYCIGEELKTYNIHDLDSEQIDDLVEKTQKSITEQRIEEALEAERKRSDSKLEELRQETKLKIDEINNKSNEIINTALEGQKRQDEENAEKRAAESYEEGKNSAIKEIMDNEIEKRTSRALVLYWFAMFVVIVLALLISFYIYTSLLKAVNLTDNKKEAMEWLKYVISLILAPSFAVLIYEKAFCKLDRKKVKERIKNRVQKKYERLNVTRKN